MSRALPVLRAPSARVPAAAALLILLCISGLASVRAEEPTAAKNPLAALPSKPGPHLDQIKALGANQWLNLGTPAADPQWGTARGSAWGAKALVLAPDLRGAFLFGEGVHGFVKPNGYAMDDLWFYDLNAHAWICLYPGMNTKTFNQRVKDGDLKIDEHGLLVDRTQQPIPVHTLIHAWGNLAYDRDLRKFAFVAGNGLSRYYMPGLKDIEEGLDLLEKQQPEAQPTEFSPWFYDVATGRFERTPATGSRGAPRQGFAQFHYLPDRKQFLIAGKTHAAFYDPAKTEWSALKPKGPMLRGADRPGCYDPKRNRIYSHDGDGLMGVSQGLMAYDIASNTWIELKPRGTAPPADNTNGIFCEYDPVHDVVVAISFRKSPGVYVYRPADNTWEDPLPFPADVPQFARAPNTCYDPQLNAFFCHTANDSGDNGVIWVYRYKPAE